MKIADPRGAIAITLDRPRTLFFGMTATWRLVEKYGVGFLAELYTVQDGKLTLKSLDVLRFYLWAGLQEEISDTGETLTEEQAAGFIRPWTMSPIFNAVVMAVTGATSTPAPPGKDEADGEPASPSADPAAHEPSTSRKPRGSSAGR